MPSHVISIFDGFDDQVDTFNALFTDILDVHAPIKRVKIKARPNAFVTTEIRQLMKTRDQWHKSAIKSNDRLHRNAYCFFRQEVKHQLRFAEKAHVRSELLNCSGNTNGIWKIINNCLPRKNIPVLMYLITRLPLQINLTNISRLWYVLLPRKLVTLLMNITLILLL